MQAKPSYVLVPFQIPITPLLRMAWSWVASTSPWARAVATISLSAGSPWNPSGSW